MQAAKAVRREGPCAPLFAWGALLIASTATAQGVVERVELERCAALDRDAAKLACFEALVRAPVIAESAEAVDAEEVAETSEPSETAVAAVDSAADTATVTSAPESVVPTATASEPIPAESTIVAAAEVSSAAASADLGAEYLVREVPPEEQEPEFVTATVSEVWRSGNRRLFFRFDNGQVWRQMESSYFHYPRNESFDVTIRQSFMGDYQMRVGGRGRMTRIVRVE